ncbi:FLYWCH domain containing protein [Trichuris trichiura]|uniref:FLYWCH domain containing protein n=1 Tax=Trichuris trichiura TaxID=36087 RepID=A0A077ZFX7_TRITR|nr:FLYWCH domain containing protein [Trichuris trichiura]
MNVANRARLVSTRNREKYIHDGHMFTFETYNHSRTIKFWRCDQRYFHDCKARLHTSVSTNEVVKEVNLHSHTGDAARIEVAAVLAAVKHRAEKTKETPALILNEAYRSLPVAVRGRMPDKSAIVKRIQRTRMAVRADSSQTVGGSPSVVVPQVDHADSEQDKQANEEPARKRKSLLELVDILCKKCSSSTA